jgi:hypothetical protein
MNTSRFLRSGEVLDHFCGNTIQHETTKNNYDNDDIFIVVLLFAMIYFVL